MDDPVFVKDFPTGKEWLTGTVSNVKGPLTYLVSLSDVHRHVDHIRSRISQATDPNSDNDVEIPTFRDTTPTTPLTSPEQGQVGPTQVSVRRQSTRNRAPPERYETSI